MNKKEKSLIALNNKLQLRLMMAAMKNSIRKSDKRQLVDAFETKIEEFENEITSTNELLAQLPKDRIAKRKVLSTLTDRLEKVSEFNYLEEDGKYYKLRRQNPRSILFADSDVKAPRGSLSQDLFSEPRSGVPEDFTVTSVELEDIKIPIEKEVYDAAMFENAEIKKLIKKEQNLYRDIVEKETNLIDKYVTNKKSADLRFKADILKEQLANDDIYLDMYINDKDEYDGLVYSETLKAYTPVQYDKYIEGVNITEDFGKKEYAPFRMNLSKQKKAVNDVIKKQQSKPFLVEPKVLWYTGETEQDIQKVMADYTSGYITPTIKDGDFVRNEEGEIRTVNTGVPNPSYKSQTMNPMSNTQQDMQNQIKPLLQRKNQNMNPGGFNMRSLLDK
tara:strand:+ start:480 stop:1646 length:1167 start_codon:yes stop_codon:yes gene_type:complete